MTDLAVFTPIECQYCGGTYAQPHDNEYGMCATCWNKVAFDKLSKANEQAEVTRYLLERLHAMSGRILAGKPVQRCQCISHNKYITKSLPNYQCGSVANYERDGRLVCHQHINATKPTYVDEIPRNPYDQLEQFLRVIAGRDSELKRRMNKAST